VTRLAAALLVLAVTLLYVLVYFTRVPNFGFSFHPRTGAVTSTYGHCAGDDCLAWGDEIVRIGSVTFERFSKNQALTFPDPRGAPFEVEVLRGGESRVLRVAPRQRGLPARVVEGLAGPDA